MVRTVDSPRCCATSSTRRLLPFLVSSELRMAGRWPSNCTSTTAPMTWVTRPIWLAAVAMNCSPSKSSYVNDRRLDRLGAGDDLDQLLGDLGLTGSVVDLGLLADHFARVAGGIVHRTHLRAVERSVIFQQRAEYLHRDVTRQKAREDFVFLRLVLVGSLGFACRLFLHDQRNDLLRRRNLRDHRLELRVEQRA